MGNYLPPLTEAEHCQRRLFIWCAAAALFVIGAFSLAQAGGGYSTFLPAGLTALITLGSWSQYHFDPKKNSKKKCNCSECRFMTRRYIW